MLNYIRSIQSKASEWLVFIHGAGGSLRTWKYQWETFRPHFHLLAIDLRDHGGSQGMEPAYDRYSFATISREVKEVLDHEGIEEAHFLSLSFGSVLLQDLSLRYPGSIRSAVMAGAVFQPDAPIKGFLRTALLFNKIFPFKWMYTIFSYLVMPYKRHQKARKIYRKEARKLEPEAYMKWVGLYHEFFQLLDRFGAQPLHFPTLIVMGKEDHVFRSSAERMASKNERAELFFLEQAGHICNIDRPEPFNELALAFYERVRKGERIRPTR
jgi:pimeloyl-ACP methyl ester carboxylesterase